MNPYFKFLTCCLLFGAFSTPVFSAEADYDTLIQESLLARNAGEFLRAEDILRQARTLARESNEVDFLLAMVLAFQERYLEANRILDAALERYPTDQQLVLGKARVLSYQGFYREAIEQADRALAANPGNQDALNLKARVFYYQRRLQEAQDTYAQVLQIDPNNLEALIGLYDTALARGLEDAASNYLNMAESVAPGHIDVISRQQQVSQPVAARHELIASFAESTLDRPGFANWYDRSLEYRYRNTSGNQYFLRTEHAHRFGLHDTQLELGTVIAGQRRTYNFSVAFTPDDEILPEYRLRAGTGFFLNQATDAIGSTTLDLALTNARYTTGDVQILNLDFTHYLLNVNAWITPGFILVKDELGDSSSGWRMGAHWQASERFLLGVDYTDAAETEFNVTSQTRAKHLYLQYQFLDDLALRLDFSESRRENSYSRDALALSLRYSF